METVMKLKQNTDTLYSQAIYTCFLFLVAILLNACTSNTIPPPLPSSTPLPSPLTPTTTQT